MREMQGGGEGEAHPELIAVYLIFGLLILGVMLWQYLEEKWKERYGQ